MWVLDIFECMHMYYDAEGYVHYYCAVYMYKCTVLLPGTLAVYCTTVVCTIDARPKRALSQLSAARCGR